MPTYYGPQYVVETGGYNIRNFFRPARNADGNLITEEDKQLPPVTWDPEVEKSLVRKLDLRITLPVWLMYVIAFIDRVNLGNVKVLNRGSPDSIENSLGTQGVEFNCIMVTWGIVVVCMAAVKNAAGLLTARFFLGFCEAGLIPGAIYYFSFWFKPTERATRNGLFFTASGFAGGVSGLLAIAMEGLNGRAGLKAWQWVFILEGIPAILLGVVMYFILLEFPNSPTSYLTPEEQDVAIRRLPSQTPSMADKTFVIREAISVFAQPAHWLFLISYFAMSIGVQSISNFLPSLLLGMGYSSPLSANLMSAWPNFAACIYYFTISYHSDYTRERILHGLLPSFVATVGSVVLLIAAKNPSTATSPALISNSVRYGMSFLLLFQASAFPVLLNLRASTLRGSTEVGLGMSSAQLSPSVAAIIAPFLFPNSDAPDLLKKDYGTHFPRPEEFFADRQNPKYVYLSKSQYSGNIKNFPYISNGLNRPVTHPDLVNAIERLLETKETGSLQRLNVGRNTRRLDFGKRVILTAYGNIILNESSPSPALSDYGNHSLVVPRPDEKYRHITTWLLLSDVTEHVAPTKIVSKLDSQHISISRRILEKGELLVKEVAVTGKAGSLMIVCILSGTQEVNPRICSWARNIFDFSLLFLFASHYNTAPTSSTVARLSPGPLALTHRVLILPQTSNLVERVPGPTNMRGQTTRAIHVGMSGWQI
ncbi:hypothetical protein HDU93_000224 [Gonapodya sp. JEL0774]|nr:hypothetical protein HDU93_000224 [Gonapodya sp. JEL0774]